jgi:hypothetical protein
MQRRTTIGNSFGFTEPSESRLRCDTDALNYPNGPYSPTFVEAPEARPFVNVAAGRAVYKRAGPRTPCASVRCWPGTLSFCSVCREEEHEDVAVGRSGARP